MKSLGDRHRCRCHPYHDRHYSHCRYEVYGDHCHHHGQCHHCHRHLYCLCPSPDCASPSIDNKQQHSTNCLGRSLGNKKYYDAVAVVGGDDDADDDDDADYSGH